LESQPELPQRGPVDVGQCMRRAVDLLGPAASKKNQTLDMEIGPMPLIMGNADYIERAAANLIENAVKYSPDGRRVSVAARLDGQSLLIEVSDNGIGIPAEDIPRIF